MTRLGHVRVSHSCQILSVDGACLSLATCRHQSRPFSSSSGLHSGSIQRGKTGDAEPVDRTRLRTVEDDLRPLNFGVVTARIDQHGGNSWRRMFKHTMNRCASVVVHTFCVTRAGKVNLQSLLGAYYYFLQNRYSYCDVTVLIVLLINNISFAGAWLSSKKVGLPTFLPFLFRYRARRPVVPRPFHMELVSQRLGLRLPLCVDRHNYCLLNFVNPMRT